VSGIILKGMTWKHPRGYDPLVACSAHWKEKTGITVEWVQRSLQDFESYPVEDLARVYDLIIIDHPHVGQVADENCLLPLDIASRKIEYEALAKASVGPSYSSYNWQGRQWALPVDAAAAVLAFRPDILTNAPKYWSDIIALARDDRVLLPLKPPHNLMVFFTLAGNLGKPCATEGSSLVDVETGSTVLEMMREIAKLVPLQCFDMDPIAVYERMSEADSAFACAPMQMGYVSYSRTGFRPKLLKFADIPMAGEDGPKGSALGGTGLAVSAFSRNPEEAIAFTYWVASGSVQKGLFSASGGQAGHSEAWEDPAVNAATADYYRGTRKTYDSGWVRPRHDGYMAFQQTASDRINACLAGQENAAAVVGDLNMLFKASFAEKAR
jgi:multiple sugar transport system substrate-binding protein